MAAKPQLHLRVNGINITNVRIRPKMVAGMPRGEREVVIEDPQLGRFPIDDTFVIEVRSDPHKKWELTTVSGLFSSMDVLSSAKYQR
jgi:hypothetical protein